MTLDRIARAARDDALAVMGAFHPDPDELSGVGTLVLLGPDEPAFWPVFTTTPEYSDGAPDPLDRWSARVVGGLADRLGLPERFDLPTPATSPCDSCPDQPCRDACPVGALKGTWYDVDTCKADLDRAGNDCMTLGCAARRACPVSQGLGRIAAQSAFHMRAFR